MGSAGDVNGDGLGDILVSTVDEQSGTSTRQAHLVLGEVFWLPLVDVVVQAAVEVELPAPDAFILGAGDLDGDQMDDFYSKIALAR